MVMTPPAATPLSPFPAAAPAVMRLAALAPLPPSLAAYGLLEDDAASGFGRLRLAGLAPARYATLLADLRRAFAAGATAGLCLVPRVRAVFFDMDATVIVQESIVELAAFAGKAAEVAAVTERAMAGELDFAQALHARVALLRGLSVDVLAQVSARLTLHAGIEAFVAVCRQRGVPAYLASGGFTQLAGPLARHVGFTAVRANVLEIADGRLTGRVEGAVVDALGKRQFLLETCAALGIQPHEAAAVGDGANDIPMLQSAGVAVGHQPKPVVLPHVHAHNQSGDHRFLTTLLFDD